MNSAFFSQLPEQICCIDTGYQRPQLAACYLIESAGEVAFIDTGTTHTVPRLMQLLDERGIARSQVRYVIPTHVHLDHAGGAGELMRQLPNAQLVVHPFGARHMIDPSKLTAGATAVYGAETFAALFGQLTPVESGRVIEAGDNLILTLGQRQLVCLDTPGHARHHICLYDEQSRGLFSGDTFGLSYRDFDSRQGPFILPTSTPVQFDPGAWHTTLKRLMELQPESIYLTHYGRVESPARLALDLHSAIDDFVAIAEKAEEEAREQQIRSGLFDWLLGKLAAHGSNHTPEQIELLLGLDLDLNAQGLEIWLQRREA